MLVVVLRFASLHAFFLSRRFASVVPSFAPPSPPVVVFRVALLPLLLVAVPSSLRSAAPGGGGLLGRAAVSAAPLGRSTSARVRLVRLLGLFPAFWLFLASPRSASCCPPHCDSRRAPLGWLSWCGLRWVASSRGSFAQFPLRPSGGLVAFEAPRPQRARMFALGVVCLAAPAFAHSRVPGACVLPLSPPVALRLLPPPSLAFVSLAARGGVCRPPRVLLRFARGGAPAPWSFVGLSPLSAFGSFRLSPRLSPRWPASRPKSPSLPPTRSASQ